nr:RNA-dependent RNA polymerase [Rhizoctonia zeae hypovirus 1]
MAMSGEDTILATVDNAARAGAALLAAGGNPDSVITAVLVGLKHHGDDLLLKSREELWGAIQVDEAPRSHQIETIIEIVHQAALFLGFEVGVFDTILSLMISGIIATDEALVAATSALLEFVRFGVLYDWISSELLGDAIAIIHNVTRNLTGTEEWRIKNPWTPLLSESAPRISIGDVLGLSMPDFDPGEREPSTGLAALVDTLNVDLEKRGLAQLKKTFVRPVRLPDKPRVSAAEATHVDAIKQRNYLIDEILEKDGALREKLGASDFTDGVWLATDDRRYESISRYQPVAPVLDEALETLAGEVADALYEHYPECWEDARVVTPEVVWKQMVKKYSPGLPYLGTFKTRRALEDSGVAKVIIDRVYQYWAEGKYPQRWMHVFTKSQTVNIEKALLGKPLRTVTADNPEPYILDQMVQLERAKRSTWAISDSGIGMPTSEPVLRHVLTQVGAYYRSINADCSQYDSRCGAFPFAVIEHLYAKGFAHTAPNVRSLVHAKHVRLLNAWLVDLPTGNLFEKNRGGATGQSATSDDNTWGMKAQVIAVWSLMTGKHPREFWATNMFHNTGDDNVWGTNDSLDFDEFKALALERFGMEFTFDANQSMWDLKYLGWKPVPGYTFREDYAMLGMPVPDVAITVDPASLLGRRSAYVYHKAGVPFRAFAEYALQRDIGHLRLCAHQREVYTAVAESYMTRAGQYVGATLVFDVKRDDEGHILSVQNPQPRGRFISDRAAERLRKLKRQMAAPSYHDVLQGHMREPDRSVKPSKYRPLAESTAITARLRLAIQGLLDAGSSQIVRNIARLASEPDVAVGYPVWPWFRGQAEQFAFYMTYQDAGSWENVSFGSFAARVRESPIYSATNLTAFWDQMQIKSERQRVLNTPVEVLRGRVALTILVYVWVMWVLTRLEALPIIGLFFLLYWWNLNQAGKWFSILSSLYYLETGKASTYISTLQPKDPVAGPKRIADLIASMFPDWVAYPLGWLTGVRLISPITDFLASIRSFAVSKRLADVSRHGARSGKWAPMAREILDDPTLWGIGVVLSADTSVGKSQEFVATMMALTPTSARHWLLLPTQALVINYHNWAYEDRVARLLRGRVEKPARLNVTTYGHFMSRYGIDAAAKQGDFLYFDEFDQETPDIGRVVMKLGPGYGKIFMSATAESIYLPPHIHRHVSPLVRPYQPEAIIERDLDVHGLIALALRDQSDMSRPLVLVVGQQDAINIAQGMRLAGFDYTAVHRGHREIPAHGGVVGTAILNAGVDLDPPCTTLIDSGKEKIVHKGRERVQWDSQRTKIQKQGRSSRRTPGRIYRHILSGSGIKPIIYPNWAILMGDPPLRRRIENKLGITNPLTPQGAGCADIFISYRWSRLTRQMRISLEVLWVLRCSAGSPAAGDELYDEVYDGNWPDPLEGLKMRLVSTYGPLDLLNRAILGVTAADPPWAVLYRGVLRPVTGLSYLDDTVNLWS